MKIDKIIKERRLALGLTQEQLADTLGVSTPAVNKWEKGVSYPDITLLPPLARLLEIDLNSLLSFKEDLTDQEIGNFINESIFNKCIKKIGEYPNCDKLILSVVLSLQGGLYMYNVSNKEEYEEKLNTLLDKCTQSKDLEIKNRAITMLIGKCREEKDYEKAQSYIDILPNITWDKTQQQGSLYIDKGELDKASEIFEAKLLKVTSDIFSTLISMMEIALKENRKDDAIYIANIIEKTNNIYELWGYNTHVAYYTLYTSTKEEEKLIDTLEKMICSLKSLWSISQGKLYKHVKTKDSSKDEQNQFYNAFINILKADEDKSLEFLKDNPRFIKLMERI